MENIRAAVSWASVGLALLCGSPAAMAGSIGGRVLDSTGSALPGASVRLENLASGQTNAMSSGPQGEYDFKSLAPGLYRVSAALTGFSQVARTLVLSTESERATEDMTLAVGTLETTVTVTASRNLRDSQVVPLRAETLGPSDVKTLNPASTGDLLLDAPGITPVANGAFQVRPRLRGLDSTRVLILVDGERLNNARSATDRAGVEVGLVDASEIESVEVVSGAGSVLYGTDALSGTINVLTRQPLPGDAWRLTGGARGYWSSNEDGRRGTLSLGASGPRIAARVAATKERFDDYHTGGPFDETSAPLFTDGRLTRADTIDDAFGSRGLRFGAFPDPFNAPYTRSSDRVPNSSFDGDNVSASVVARPGSNQTLSVRYLRRHVTDVGFPDFAQPFFFQGITLPFSNLDKVSAQYGVRSITPWFANLRAIAYYQRQDRKLTNVAVPVQFPAPTARTFFPINVLRLVIDSSTEQDVRTPGLDVQGTFLLSPRNVLTGGFTVYRDRSADTRLSVSQLNLVGSVVLGPRGPQPVVQSELVPLGPPSQSRPTRVPKASFRDFGVFAQDEWDIGRKVHVVAGVRFDSYGVRTKPTAGYDVATLVAGATPSIDPSTLPNVAGDRISRSAFTGDIGLIYKASDRVSLLAHVGRSYRHPNLEELLFAGPATIGNIIPNVKVAPEKGDNIDVGVKVRTGRVSEQISYFNNTYRGFISQEIVARLPGNQFLSQAQNFTKVRIQGVEADIELPFSAGKALFTAFGSGAYNHGQVLSGTNRLTGASLRDTPQDNISPLKIVTGLRVADSRNRFWAEYASRYQKKVERVSPVLLDSPFVIAQDYFGLGGFTLHRIAAGYDWSARGYEAGVTVAVENLGDRFYREQFQFAPGRGRSLTVGLRLERR